MGQEERNRERRDPGRLPYGRTVRQICNLATEMEAAEDAAFPQMTEAFRRSLADGAKTEDILPRAYAAVREAARRVLGMYPYPVQLSGAVALQRGRIAQMRTGEGKTLTAAMPLYLHALTGESTILLTMNDYLARRDAQQLTPLYAFLGLRCETSVPPAGGQLTAQEKRERYQADIVYTTHSILAFDYLSHNLAVSREDRFLRPFSYCIIDEADAVLLDSAHVPLVISGAPRYNSNLFGQSDDFVSMLQETRDYAFSENRESVYLTEEGIRRACRFFRTEDLFSREQAERMRHINLALRAHGIFRRERQYVVQEDEIRLLAEGSGRIMESTKLRGGQHQAIEAKEHLPVTRQTRSTASITYQAFFSLFPHVAGMTGSAIYNRGELREIYGLRVCVIPTNRPLLRRDEQDRIYGSRRAQREAAIEDVIKRHGLGQPVLLLASSIDEVDDLSRRLLEAGIAHSLLHAYHAAYEARIIAEAGEAFAVTVATAMAGRGTDIKLTEEARRRGGLAVICVGRMENRRREMQARGRAGRQGDPGCSRFYLSLEDEILEKYGPRWLQKWRGQNQALPGRRFLRAAASAQHTSEELLRSARKDIMEYGRSMRRQREVIYRMRDAILEGAVIRREEILENAGEVIDRFLDQGNTLPDRDALCRFILDHISYQLEEVPGEDVLRDRASRFDYLKKQAEAALDRQAAMTGEDALQQDFYRMMTLRAIDDAWIEQVDYLQQLRLVVSGRASAGRNPVEEYGREAAAAFGKMEHRVKRDMMRNILLGTIVRDPDGQVRVIMP